TIRFVGVWDTVSVYGGPITEITRAIDNWIYLLSMPNYQLDERILCARHALAIDDERDAFHPLLWDEVHEEALVAEERVGPDRLQQVWFTGMHADVGGGYPDESLSYVSLLWMMEQAERAGLRTLKVIKDRFVALASSYGPIHDSRAGLGAYYRYQPRKIAAWLDPVDEKTLSLRDPAITDASGKSRGLLRAVTVHESVINRIATGTDRYAPITLPQNFRVVPPQMDGEKAPQADNQTPEPPPETKAPPPMVSRGVRARLADAQAANTRARAIEPIWNLVWWRRLTYFATLTATLLLLILPLVVARLPHPPFLADGRTWIGGIIRLLTLALPTLASEWVEVYADNPFYFFLLGGVIVAFLKVGTRLERTLRDEARTVWRRATEDGLNPVPALSRIQKFRNSRRYQRVIQLVKWSVLPDWVFGPLIVFVLFWIGLATYAQARLPFLENSARLCRSSSGDIAEVAETRADFRTRDVCSASFGRVVKTQRYIVTFDVVDPWYDSSVATTPEGIGVGDFPWGVGYLAAPFRRVIDARYLQPVVEVRPTDGSRRLFSRNIQIYPLSVRPVGDSRTLYRAEFVAPRTGELFLFANDAMVPLTARWWGKYDYRHFYEASGFGAQRTRGNHGSACVTVERANAADVPLGAPPAGSVCERASASDAAGVDSAHE
ncbi:MAG: phospholipase effector Tle1 domain-containing protein, partial [Luteitalea sp.]